MYKELQIIKNRMDFENIRILHYNLPTTVHGFTYYSKMKVYYVILNNNLTLEMQQQTLIHELYHIEAGHFEASSICDITGYEKETRFYVQTFKSAVEKRKSKKIGKPNSTFLKINN